MFLLFLLSAGSARAEFGIVGFDAKARTAAGAEELSSSVHPYDATTSIDFNTVQDGFRTFTDENVRDIIVDLPAGFVGDPSSLGECPRLGNLSATCPPATQVGIVKVVFTTLGFPATIVLPVYNMKRPKGVIADFGFVVSGVPVHVAIGLRQDGDYGVRASLRNVSQAAPFISTELTLWGAPADPVHDSQRCVVINPDLPVPACASPTDPTAPGYDPRGVPQTAGVAVRPFLTNPAPCGAPLVTKLSVRSWQHPDLWKTAAATSSSGLKGCEGLGFAPGLQVSPDTQQADAATGLNVDLSVKQADLSATRATPPLKDVRVTLPDGMTINPSSADGLGACSDAQLGLGTNNPNVCPESSKIGTVTAVSPALQDPIEGAVYLRSQNSDDPASGEMFRIAIVLDQPDTGLLVRLPGSIKVDPRTGRIVTEFDNNPQLPVSKLSVRFKTGPRAPLATPPTCGEKTVDAHLTSWGGHAVDLQSKFVIDCSAGLGGFTPSFSAGSAQPTGGAFSPFAVGIKRPDGNQALDGISLTLPVGLTAKLAGVARCSDAGAAAGTCPAASRVGSAAIGAGSGSLPFWLKDQPVYLTDGYKGGQFGLVAVVRAVAGPFDLGTVIVRQAIHIDPITAQVTVVSDPLPTIVKGVPIRLRNLDVNVDKPGFMLNPTSCSVKSVGGVLHGQGGATANVSTRFQVGDCASLALKPSLGLTLSGKGQTKDGGHPAVSAVLSQPAGQANLKRVRVALPLSLALDPDNSNSDGMCSFVEGSKPDPKCPASSVVGKATAVTPILNQPLSGPVYFVKNERKDPKSGRSIKTTPKLVIPLAGENGVKLTLTGASTVSDDQLVTTFDNIPDAPVTSFKMDITGGKKGILVISGDKADICKSTQVADQQIDGQNGKQADTDVAIQTPSCPLKVISKKVGKSSVTVTVGGLGAGKVTVTGKGLKKTRKTISKSTVATITAKRTKGTPGKVTVSFDPAGPAKARKTTK